MFGLRSVLRSFLAIVNVMLGTGPVFGASIGLFSRSDCSKCDIAIPQGGVDTIYARVMTAGLPPTGIVGATFRITGLPEGWMAIASPNPIASSSGGDIFGSGGGLVFPTYQTGDCIGLYTIAIFAGTPAQGTLRVESAQFEPLGCPVVDVGDCNGCFALVCVSGGQLFINSATECTVAVETKPWSSVKALYKE